MNLFRNPRCRLWFIGLDLNKAVSRKIDIQHEVQNFMDLLNSMATTQNIYVEGMSVRISILSAVDFNLRRAIKIVAC